jgi:hypothetical protein
MSASPSSSRMLAGVFAWSGADRQDQGYCVVLAAVSSSPRVAQASAARVDP